MNRGLRNELMFLTGLGALLALRLKNKQPAMALAAASAGVWLFSRSEAQSFEDQSVIITGGSRGLGLAIAQQLAREGARVAILARDGVELAEAKKKIISKTPDAEILPIACDITDNEESRKAFAQVAETFGGIDMLVNNAGAITVGPYEKMRKQDFTAQLELHFYAIMHAVELALPHLRRSSGRRIVNICSMGGKVAVPHMLPYDVSKFALSGYSQGIMSELAQENISVTTVYPALMRTGSPIQAVFKGDHEKEYLWFASGDVTPLLSASANSVARKVVEAARHRRTELVPSFIGKARGLGSVLFPEIVAGVLKFMGSLMPTGGDATYKTGEQSSGLFKESLLTKPLQTIAHRVEKEFNQRPKSDAKFNMGLK